jgi:hypothetical protein
MKKIFLTLAIFCLAINVNAQEGHEGHNHAKGEGHGQSKGDGKGHDHDHGKDMKDMTPADAAAAQTKHVTKLLTLSEDQAAKFSALSLQRIEANRALRAEMKTTTDKARKVELRKQAEANRASFDANVRGMLTAEQAKLWDDKKDKMKGKKEEKKDDKKQKKGKKEGKGKKEEKKETESEEIED